MILPSLVSSENWHWSHSWYAECWWLSRGVKHHSFITDEALRLARDPQSLVVVVLANAYEAEGIKSANRWTGLLTIPRKVLQAVFDTATSSLNFGSGFLDEEEVEALRQCAELLGVDPILATPSNLVCIYKGEHHWQDFPGWQSGYYQPSDSDIAAVMKIRGLLDEENLTPSGKEALRNARSKSQGKPRWICVFCRHVSYLANMPSPAEQGVRQG